MISNSNRYLALFIVLMLLAWSCKNVNDTTLPACRDTGKLDAVKSDITIDEYGNYPQYFKHLQNINKRLELCNLLNGFDSLIIRVAFPFRVSSYVVEIWLTKGEWYGRKIDYSEISDFNGNDSAVKILRNENVEPMNGWETFINNLVKNDILVLPDCLKVDGYSGMGTDGDSYLVEVATNENYRFYHYWQPFDNINTSEGEKFCNIINMITSELNIRWDH